ncbi:pyrroline-5-carboxylate reductase family protein [Bordetella holmesii]|uniref:pyrroline-5-carboxylate reductase family protein n=1 Tax=Bordetella holmesii TaxID=35814 RepID=UPI00045B5C23|nr:pyrroline-5-carboxylate reductase [Bordetella holmesii]KAK77768.1 putative pyrroline-5-carboxylate reductase [Bordetella holmesii CDC-H809-BH]
MENPLSIAFIGGGNMASALAVGLADKVCPAHNIHVVDINVQAHAFWLQRGMTAAAAPDAALARCRVWIFAVKPQVMRDVVQAVQPWLEPDTLVISVAAGLRADTLAGWLGQPERPWSRLVRCMPNTPALVGQGMTGMAALDGVSAADRQLAQTLLGAVGEVVWVADDAALDAVTAFKFLASPEVAADRQLAQTLLGAVGEVVWVADDAALDAVTALSGSGPAYVFLFIEALIAGGQAVGLSAEQARQLALGTLRGATTLASQAEDPPSVLRERVTSKGGTTAAALAVLEQADMRSIVARAIEAAARRSEELGEEFGK